MRARLKGERFYCRALRGEPGYMMSVASDLSLLCNCNDKYGLGKIGDIRAQSLGEILSGEKATYFRLCLARGHLPIISCVTCSSLGRTKKKDAHTYPRDYNLPSEIMVENTVNCNLRCIACERERIYRNRAQREMSLDDVRFVSALFKENRIQKVYYFNYGEPFLSKSIRKELEVIRNDNPHIVLITSTNGLLLDQDEKMEAALIFDHIFFSIDGASQESVARYQRGGDFERTFTNMKRLIETRNARGEKRPVIEWKYVLFRWNDHPHLLRLAEKLAREIRVDILSFWPTLSPFYGISFRYFLGWNYFKHIGEPSWKGMEIDFRKAEP